MPLLWNRIPESTDFPAVVRIGYSPELDYEAFATLVPVHLDDVDPALAALIQENNVGDSRFWRYRLHPHEIGGNRILGWNSDAYSIAPLRRAKALCERGHQRVIAWTRRQMAADPSDRQLLGRPPVTLIAALDVLAESSHVCDSCANHHRETCIALINAHGDCLCPCDGVTPGLEGTAPFDVLLQSLGQELGMEENV